MQRVIDSSESGHKFGHGLEPTAENFDEEDGDQDVDGDVDLNAGDVGRGQAGLHHHLKEVEKAAMASSRRDISIF